jgi:hypothetical protein
MELIEARLWVRRRLGRAEEGWVALDCSVVAARFGPTDLHQRHESPRWHLHILPVGIIAPAHMPSLQLAVTEAMPARRGR